MSKFIGLLFFVAVVTCGLFIAMNGFDFGLAKLGLLQPVFAINDARELIREGKTQQALPILNYFSARGNSTADTVLAGIYASGRGVNRDLQKVAEIFERMASRGDVSAMLYLAGLHYCGGLGPQDKDATRKWLEDAASHGSDKGVRSLKALDQNRLTCTSTAPGTLPEKDNLPTPYLPAFGDLGK